MAHRTFTGPDGREWQAWDVSPQALRALEDRREIERRDDGARGRAADRRTPPNRRRTLDRRAGARFAVRRELGRGWLAFACGATRRRLAPVPAGWERLPDAELARLCERARPAPLRRGVPSHVRPTRAADGAAQRGGARGARLTEGD
jgi:hypothetical protein